MSSRATLVTLLLPLLLAALRADDGCSVNMNDPSLKFDTQPLLLKPGGSHDVHGFVTPDSSGKISLAKGDQMILACPDNDNAVSVTGKPQVTATCVSGPTFSIIGKYGTKQNIIFADLKCIKMLRAAAHRRCGQYKVINLGFKVGPHFYTLIEVCFDDEKYRTVYDKFIMVAQIAGRQTGIRIKDWMQGDFFPEIPDVTLQYNVDTQLKTVEKLLGSNELAKMYINKSGGKYLTKGHLTANADFMFGAQSVATFWYVNAAPQWRDLNSGNWQIMENDVRSYASKNFVSLEIYTGTHGIMTLPYNGTKETELYLYVDGKKRYIPVPNIFWKIVYNANTMAAVAFMSVNNPQINEPVDDYFGCQDVCSQISWITWQPKNKKKGYSRCCKYADFKNAVADVPDLTVDKLLT